MEIYEYDNIEIWMEKLEISNIFDWKKVFKKFKLILNDNDFKSKLNCLSFLKKLVYQISITDSDIMVNFNSIIQDLISFLKDDVYFILLVNITNFSCENFT